MGEARTSDTASGGGGGCFPKVEGGESFCVRVRLT